VLEAGYSGDPRVGTVPTVMPALDRPIAADQSGSVVVDVPFGLRGGLAPYGRRISYQALVLATADGHPRAGSYTSWVPASSVAVIARHPFFRRLSAAESGRGSSGAQLRSARQSAGRLERELAGSVRRRSRLLHGAPEPDPAGDDGAQGPAGR
jgi:hypothetical protein